MYRSSIFIKASLPPGINFLTTILSFQIFIECGFLVTILPRIEFSSGVDGNVRTYLLLRSFQPFDTNIKILH